ncbi:hypothetical protein [Amycolatopsis sp. GM8]|uniref:hypothetical protein n=1 Tax=Amycolatopsis sp. GM8 TaxID=2896530 RepID=UPI001F48BA07|nr:hypothetical protein [Amycolatopsis sp. GM8]
MSADGVVPWGTAVRASATTAVRWGRARPGALVTAVRTWLAPGMADSARIYERERTAVAGRLAGLAADFP